MNIGGILRGAVLVLGAGFLLLAAAFITQQPIAVDLWPRTGPYPETGFASLFVGSMLAAIGSGAVYVAWLGDMRAAAGGALALLVLYAGMAVAAIAYSDPAAGHDLRPRAAAFVAFAVIAAAMFVATARLAPGDRRPVPALVRGAFFIFTAVLVVTGTMLLLRVARVFPWPLPPLSSVLYGCMFLGFAGNYLYAAVRGTMADAKVSLLGFFVYDAVLIVPFLRHFASVADDYRFSLAFYTANLVFSAVVAVYCFALDRRSAIPSGKPA